MSALPATTLAPSRGRRGRRTTPLLIQRLRERIGYAIAQDNCEAGFSLIEAVVAMSIFAVVATASVFAMVNGMKASGTTKNQVTAVNLAQQNLAQARALGDHTQIVTQQSSSVQNGVTYKITRSVPTQCPAVSNANLTAITVTTTVTWPDSKGVSMATVLAC